MIRDFIDMHFQHFNARELRMAAQTYLKLLRSGCKFVISLGGAMSTAEIGISLAEMIRKDAVHAIVCTGANLEEDIYNLIAQDRYVRVPHYKDLTPSDEKQILDGQYCRITDVLIPVSVMEEVDSMMSALWEQARTQNASYFPHQYFYQLIESEHLNPVIDPSRSWLLAAKNKELPIFVPGWEDSTLGNAFASEVFAQTVDVSVMKTGIEYMVELIRWYRAQDRVGFFQIGGGIAGDFPICCVPLIREDLKEQCQSWQYFCQISDSTTSYGSYSGAVPNEKITWNKLDVNTPKFMIESDATICAPLIFQYIIEGCTQCMDHT